MNGGGERKEKAFGLACLTVCGLRLTFQVKVGVW